MTSDLRVRYVITMAAAPEQILAHLARETKILFCGLAHDPSQLATHTTHQLGAKESST